MLLLIGRFVCWYGKQCLLPDEHCGRRQAASQIAFFSCSRVSQSLIAADESFFHGMDFLLPRLAMMSLHLWFGSVACGALPAPLCRGPVLTTL